MANDLTTFNFHNTSLRVITIDNEPWFVAADVCSALYTSYSKDVGVSRHIQHINLQDSERKTVTRKTLGNTHGIFEGVRSPSYVLVSESGLYKLIMRSNKPEAKEFQDWVTQTVLTALRKDGAYIMGEEKVSSGEMSEDELVLKAVSILQSKVERLTTERDTAVAQRDTAHTVIGTHLHTLDRFAQTMRGVNRNSLKRCLGNLGYLFHRGGTWNVYAKHQDKFVPAFNDTHGVIAVKVTDAGKRCLLEHYRNGDLPLKKGFTPDGAVN